MAFFRSLRNSLHLGKSSSDDSTPTPVNSKRPEKENTGFRRNVTNSASFLSRGNTFILTNEKAQDSNSSKPQHSNSSTLEKKMTKPKMLGKFNTHSAHQSVNESCARLPSDHATNTHYKWKSEAPTNLAAVSDPQTDPFNFLYEKPSSLKELRQESANTEQRTSSGGTHKPTPSTSFDSSTFRRTKDRMQSDSKKSDEGTLRNPQKSNRMEHQKHRKQSSKAESEKYRTVTINNFRKSFREKLLNQLKEAPHNPPWFVEVEQPGAEVKEVRSHHELPLESRPDFLLFKNENYKPLSKSTLCERQSRRPEPSKCSIVKRNETFRIVPSSTSGQPEPSPKKEPTIRIEFKNSITPNVPGRIVPVGVAKPMPSSLVHNHNSTNHHTRRLTKLESPLEASASSTKSSGDRSTNRNWRNTGPGSLTFGNATSLPGRYQTLIQIRNDSNVITKPVDHPTPPTVCRNSTPIRIELKGHNDNGAGLTQHHNSTNNISKKASQCDNRSHASSHPNESLSILSHHPKQSNDYFGSGSHPLELRGSKSSSFESSRGRLLGASTGAPNKVLSRFVVPMITSSVPQQRPVPMAVPKQRRSKSPTKLPWK